MGKIEHALTLHTSQTYEFDFFSNSEKLLRHLNNKDINYTIYFISIEMADMDGIALAQKIRSFDLEALIIFVSDDLQRMPEVFKVQAFDYLLKPISQECLLPAMDRAKNYLHSTNAYFEFTFNRKLIVLPIDKIVYIGKHGRLAYIHTAEKYYKTYMTMAEITDKLDKYMFTKIHGSYIVNFNNIVKIVKNEVFIKKVQKNSQGAEVIPLPVSRAFKNELKAAYGLFLRTRKF